MNEITLEDCIVGMSKLDSESFDIVIADPPYNIGKDFGNDSDKMEIGEYVNWCEIWMKEAIRCLKQNGTMFIYGFDEILAYLSVKLPIDKIRWLTWFYTNKTVATAKFWQVSHESIICHWKDINKRIFNKDLVREPYNEPYTKLNGKSRKNTPGRFQGKRSTTYQVNPNGALGRDVIQVGALAGGRGMAEGWFYSISKQEAFPNKEKNNFPDEDRIHHPTVKPKELTTKLLNSCKPEKGGKVLIPFAGSGSECGICLDLNLDFTAFEINPNYVKMANSFLEKRKNNGTIISSN